MIGGKQELAWAFPQFETRLRDQVDTFFTRCRRDGTLARLIERYYSRGQVTRLDAGVFYDRVKSLLPQFRENFERGLRVPRPAASEVGDLDDNIGGSGKQLC